MTIPLGIGLALVNAPEASQVHFSTFKMLLLGVGLGHVARGVEPRNQTGPYPIE